MTIFTIAPPADPVIRGQNGWPAQGQWRYADYLHLPDDGRRYEIIEGVLYVGLVDLKWRGVEVYTLSNSEYALLGQYAGNDVIESQVLTGLQIKANDLFPPAQ